MKTLTLCILGFPYLIHAAELLIRAKQVKRILRKIAIVGFIAAGVTHFGEALHSATNNERAVASIQDTGPTGPEYQIDAWQAIIP